MLLNLMKILPSQEQERLVCMTQMEILLKDNPHSGCSIERFRYSEMSMKEGAEKEININPTEDFFKEINNIPESAMEKRHYVA